MAQQVDIDTQEFVQGFEDALSGELRQEIAKIVARYWRMQSKSVLRTAAKERDSDGLNHIAEAATDIQVTSEGVTWKFDHVGAVYQNFGTRPHEVRAKKAEVLAFEWPEAPQEVKEQFEHTEGDLVFFEKTNNPGLPALQFMEKGRDRAVSALEGLSLDALARIGRESVEA